MPRLDEHQGHTTIFPSGVQILTQLNSFDLADAPERSWDPQGSSQQTFRTPLPSPRDPLPYPRHSDPATLASCHFLNTLRSVSASGEVSSIFGYLLLVTQCSPSLSLSLPVSVEVISPPRCFPQSPYPCEASSSPAEPQEILYSLPCPSSSHDSSLTRILSGIYWLTCGSSAMPTKTKPGLCFIHHYSSDA